jgi:glutathione synthase/RimK-type ligase-like ATP-grasp enzyme
MTIRIEPYRIGSGGAKALADRCGILRATRQQVERHGDFDYIINWGRNEERFNGCYINNPTAVRTATDKLETARAFAAYGVPQPDFTNKRGEAEAWLAEGHTVLARTMLRASAGRGIVLVDAGEGAKLPDAPLYTKYIKKSEEYRIHVFQGEVIDEQIKRRRKDTPDDLVDWRIRNHDRGFVFARTDLDVPECVHHASLAAVAALGLDFGAVDVGFNRRRTKCRVYEVNTAPGLEGTTLERYYEAFAKRFPEIKGGAYARRRR